MSGASSYSADVRKLGLRHCASEAYRVPAKHIVAHPLCNPTMEVVEYAQHTFALVEDVDLSSSTNTLPCTLAPSNEVWEGQLWSATLNSNPVAFLFLRRNNWTLVDNEICSLEDKYSVKLPTVSTSANRMAVVLDNISGDTKTDLILSVSRIALSRSRRPLTI